VSISSTFYIRIFRTNVVSPALFLVTCPLRVWHLYEKRASIKLMKLTAWNHNRLFTRNYQKLAIYFHRISKAIFLYLSKFSISNTERNTHFFWMYDYLALSSDNGAKDTWYLILSSNFFCNFERYSFLLQTMETSVRYFLILHHHLAVVLNLSTSAELYIGLGSIL